MKKIISLSAILVILSSCGNSMEEEEDFLLLEDALETHSQSIIIGTEDWSPINLQTPGSSYPEIKTSGRAVFRYNNSCTAFLINDEYAITNWHCVEDVWPSSVYKTADFDPNSTASSFLLKRLHQLGISSSYATVLSTNTSGCRPWEEWEKFDRDQVVLKCVDVAVGDAKVPFGAIWGHVNTSILPFSENENAAVIGANQRTFTPSVTEILWSGATITDTNISSCSWDTAFEHTGDTMSGSSGSPVFSKSTRTAKGVHFGTCGSSSYNAGTLFPPRLSTFRDSPPTIQNLPYTSHYRNASMLGNPGGGTAKTLTCPSNYAVVGIVGDTYNYSGDPDHNLGDFGIICAPYVKDFSTTPILQTAHYTIHTVGSYNNGFVPY